MQPVSSESVPQQASSKDSSTGENDSGSDKNEVTPPATTVTDDKSDTPAEG